MIELHLLVPIRTRLRTLSTIGATATAALEPIGDSMLDKRSRNQGKRSRKRNAPGEIRDESAAAEVGADESDVKSGA